ncbi:BamA/TamA family outer membrane protein, partial [bacterium]|nr:BamA/TamA family outer membrane protein [bacterium]
MLEHRDVRFVKHGIFSLLAATALAGVSMPVHAQVPPTADPGRQERELRTRITPETKPVTIERKDEKQGLDIKEGGAKFTLQSVQLEGVTVFDQAKVQESYARYIGTEVTLADLQRIADAVTAFYRNEGYILSQAIVPPQRVKGGVARIQVIEGGVSNIRLEGGSADQRGLVQSYLNQIPLRAPVKASELERYLLLAEDLPGMSARAVIQPSASEKGMADVVVVLEEKKIDGSLGIDNRGSRYLGPYLVNATAGFNNIFGLNERTQVRGVMSAEGDELAYGEIVHDEYVGSEGTRIRLQASTTDTNPGSKLESLDIAGNSFSYAAYVTQPLLRSRQSNLFATGGFEYRNSRLSNSSSLSYVDKLRVASASLAYDMADKYFGVNRFELGIYQGLDVLNAGETPAGITTSRVNGDEKFTKATFDATRVQPISGPWTAEVAFSGQLSADPLLASEEFGIGGPSFGRGYDPSEITGDSGAAGRLELQYNDTLSWVVVQDYQVYGFYDVGKVWNRDVQTGSGEEKTATLASTGLGVRFNGPYDL